jgi:hypothetical protein
MVTTNSSSSSSSSSSTTVREKNANYADTQKGLSIVVSLRVNNVQIPVQNLIHPVIDRLQCQ